jgi:hypothetical protein
LAWIEHVPTETNVIAPPEVTVHTPVVVDVYVIAGEPPPLSVEVAAGTGGVEVNAVFASAGNVITSVPAVTVKLCVTPVAAA